MTQPLVFLDTETTSLRDDRVAWDIAVIRRDEDGDTEHQWFVDVDTDDLVNADPFALRIGGFYRRHPLGIELARGIDKPWPDGDPAAVAIPAHKAAENVARVTHGATVVASNPHFDLHTLGRLLHAHGIPPARHYHPVDVVDLAAATLRRTVDSDTARRVLLAHPWKSEQLAERLGVTIPAEDRHTALGDARWVRDIYDACMGAGA